MSEPRWMRRNRIAAEAREHADFYRGGDPARLAAFEAVPCECGHNRAEHEVLDGECDMTGCPCRGFKTRKSVAVEEEW